MPVLEDTNDIRTEANRKFCRDQIAALRYEGIYTPPSIRGTLVFPGNIGGVNWGSPALDSGTGILYANTNRLAFAIHLIDKPAHDSKPFYVRRDYWAILALIAVALGCALRRSWNPGVIGISLMFLAILAITYITHLYKLAIQIALKLPSAAASHRNTKLPINFCVSRSSTTIGILVWLLPGEA